MSLRVKILSILYVILLSETPLLAQIYHISIPDIKQASIKKTIVIPIIVAEDLSGQGITAYTADISWDSTIIKNPATSQAETLTESWRLDGYYQYTKKSGELRFGHFVDTPALKGSGTFVNLIFDVVGKAGDMTAITINLFTLNGIKANISNGSFIINNPPTASELTLVPLTPKTNDNLVGRYMYRDVDGDPEDSTEICWYKNDRLQFAFHHLLSVANNATVKGDRWYFTVCPNDGEEFGLLATSPSVIIGNTAPTVDSLMISPSSPLDGDSLIGFYFYHDADHDPENGSEIRWYRNGIYQAAYMNEHIIPATATTAGDRWHFVVRPKDDTDFGIACTSPPVTIESSALTANFTTDKTSGIEQLRVQFTDMSQGPITAWHWDFGDGTTSTLQNPIHHYNSTQKYYTVSLIVQSLAGTDTLIKENYITIHRRVSANLMARPIVGKNALTVQFTNNTDGDADHYIWNFGDGIEITIDREKQHPTHSYQNVGNFTVSLYAYGDGGIDSIVYKNLICVDQAATDLVLVKSGATKPNYDWTNAIDHDVITDDGKVEALKQDAWAIFAFADSVDRFITKLRLRRSIYQSHTEPGKKAEAFEILVSSTGTDSSNFELLLSEEFLTDEWIRWEMPDSVRARYILLKILNAEAAREDIYEFGEFQVFGVPAKPVTVEKLEQLADNILPSPTAFGLVSNYPNPFNPETTIEFYLSEEAKVSLSIYNIHGQFIRKLINGAFSAGSHQIVWDGCDKNAQPIGSGTYICRMQVVNRKQKIFSFARKMILLR